MDRNEGLEGGNEPKFERSMGFDPDSLCPGTQMPFGRVYRMTSVDVTKDLKDLAFRDSHVVPMMFWPFAWATSQNESYSWVATPFPPAARQRIPKEPGVYAFVVSTNVFGFPAASGLFYVGKATSLYDRIGAYIGEKNRLILNTRRPKIWQMINQWESHLIYYYTTTNSVAEAEDLEKKMLRALRPPFNTVIPAFLGPTTGAFV